MAKSSKIIIACVSTFPPRECGIATFTKDLITAYNNLYLPEAEMRVVAMKAPGEKLRYKNLLATIDQDSQKSYIKAARQLNKNKRVKLVSIQHEFGIFGGSLGEYLELFLKTLTKPAVATLHTVLPNPTAGLLERVTNLTKLCSGVIVMTNRSKQILLSDYKIPEEKITIIPHGIHPLRYTLPAESKTKLSLPKTPIISTFGLLSKNKGIEYIISALPKVIKKFPTLRYFIIGKTHPVVKRLEGEAYLEQLEALVKKLKLVEHVKFIKKYFTAPTLLKYLQATDIYISGSLDKNQAVSGTLSYALGTGRPVISTMFSQAEEDVTPDVGALVQFKNPQDFSNHILRLLGNDKLRSEMGKNAYFKTRHMTWPNVGLAYAKYFSGFAGELSRQYKNLPPIKLDHIKVLTDNFGIFQFASLHVPDPGHGYTLDDNARALIAMAYYYKKFGKKEALPLAKKYLNFIKTAADQSGGFHNYFTAERKVNTAADTRDSLEDANARCLWALMTVAGTSVLPKNLQDLAKKLYNPALDREFKSPRAAAFYIKGLCALPKTPSVIKAISLHADFLVSSFKQFSSTNWQWFEKKLTYSNALLPEALLLAFKATGKKQYFNVGKKTLDFLIGHTFVDGMYMAIGQDGWFEQGGVRAKFDQQPEDPAAMVWALKTMSSITGQKKYYGLMQVAFRWFLGDNELGQFVYDTVTGGSYDGISPKKTNLNQGAESSLSYLLARLAL